MVDATQVFADQAATDEERWSVPHAAMLVTTASVILWGLLIGAVRLLVS